MTAFDVTLTHGVMQRGKSAHTADRVREASDAAVERVDNFRRRAFRGRRAVQHHSTRIDRRLNLRGRERSLAAAVHRAAAALLASAESAALPFVSTGRRRGRRGCHRLVESESRRAAFGSKEMSTSFRFFVAACSRAVSSVRFMTVV